MTDLLHSRTALPAEFKNTATTPSPPSPNYSPVTPGSKTKFRPSVVCVRASYDALAISFHPQPPTSQLDPSHSSSLGTTRTEPIHAFAPFRPTFHFLSDSQRMAALWAVNMGCDESFHVSPLRLLLHPSPLHHTSVLVLHTHEGSNLHLLTIQLFSKNLTS